MTMIMSFVIVVLYDVIIVVIVVCNILLIVDVNFMTNIFTLGAMM